MIVIADSSALVALSICDCLSVLDELFGEVKVPPAVYDEVCILGKAESKSLSTYLQDKVCDISTVIHIEKTNGLGKGELAAINLYKQLAADLLLIDDARAKKIAYINNVEVMGSSDIFISDHLLERLLVIAGE